MEASVRVLTIALNVYREAVRARVLYALLAVAFATTAYGALVATLSLHDEKRVVADLGTGAISMCAVIVAVVLGATSLHRELELKTIFPILTRPLRRHEYLVGKFLGSVATLAVFIALHGATVLAVLALEAGQKPALVLGAAGLLLAILGVGLVRARFARVFVAMPWSFAAFLAMLLLAEPAGSERQLVLASCVLTLGEVAIVSALATAFASFSSPVLTAVFTFGVFVLGRSADTLAHLPKRMLPEPFPTAGRGFAHVLPNLQAYVPPRAVLLGEMPDTPTWTFVLRASANAFLYSVVLLTIAALLFRRRDFQ